MADPFAFAQDVAARWRPLSATETATAATLTVDASVIVRAECSGIDARITAETLDADLVKQVVATMVKRAMVGGPELAGVSNEQETAGPFMRGVTYANPLGDLYLTRQERRRLGYGGVKAGSAPMADPDLYVEDETVEE
jgi:hypothetical protein